VDVNSKEGEMVNEYEPWMSCGMSELDYFKAQYLEARRESDLAFARGKREGAEEEKNRIVEILKTIQRAYENGGECASSRGIEVGIVAISVLPTQSPVKEEGNDKGKV
jgi:hypothetical protein